MRQKHPKGYLVHVVCLRKKYNKYIVGTYQILRYIPLNKWISTCISMQMEKKEKYFPRRIFKEKTYM